MKSILRAKGFPAGARRRKRESNVPTSCGHHLLSRESPNELPERMTESQQEIAVAGGSSQHHQSLAMSGSSLSAKSIAIAAQAAASGAISTAAVAAKSAANSSLHCASEVTDTFTSAGKVAVGAADAAVSTSLHHASLVTDGITHASGTVTGAAEAAVGVSTRMIGHAGKVVVSSIIDTAESYATAAQHKGARLIGSSSSHSDDEVDSPTPEALWYTPCEGWPVNANSEKQPPLLMPTARDVPSLFAPWQAAVGELRVEILEAQSLRKTDFMSQSIDPYAMLLFEGFATRTSTVHLSTNPRWTTTSHRAFKFPVLASFSDLYVAIYDEDGIGSNRSDNLGRVVIELATLHSDTVYDVWLPLQFEAMKQKHGERGHVRVRYSVIFRSVKARLLSYTVAAPTFMIPFKTRADLHRARFAFHGKTSSSKFRWTVLRSHITELSENYAALTAAMGSLQNVLFWRTGSLGISVLCCIGWQVLLSYPHFFPASIPLLCAYLLQRLKAKSEFKIFQQPDLVALCLAERYPLVVVPPTRISAAASHASESSDDSDSDSEGSSSGRGAMKIGKAVKHFFKVEPKVSEVCAHIFKEARELSDAKAFIGLVNGAVDPKAFLRLLAEEPDCVQEVLDRQWTEENEVKEGKARVMEGLGTSMNPLAQILGPLQRKLGALVRHVRLVRRLLTWQDAVPTALLQGSLLVASVVFALVPWCLFLRIVGLILLGPHMHLVGKHMDTRKAEEAASEAALNEEFHAADDKGRAKILHAQMVAREEKESVIAGSWEDAEAWKLRIAFLRNSKFNLKIESFPSSSGLKYRNRADPYRSRAYATAGCTELG